MLPVLPLTFRFRAEDGGTALEFAGSAWRGAFGFALKRTVCVMRLRPCTGCAFENSCAYPFVFETRPDPKRGVLQGADRTLHPFVLRPPPDGIAIGSGGLVEVGMTLIGPASGYLPYVVHAMTEAGARGIGRARSRMILEAVHDPRGNLLWEPGSNLAPQAAEAPLATLRNAEAIRVRFRSPVRLVRAGVPIGPDDLDGQTLVMAAIRRVGLLRALFTDEVATPDFPALKQLATKATVRSKTLDWADRRRFSTRQDRRITMGGLTGQLELDLSEAPALLPWLETTQHVHLGKGATLGFGQIDLEPV